MEYALNVIITLSTIFFSLCGAWCIIEMAIALFKGGTSNVKSWATHKVDAFPKVNQWGIAFCLFMIIAPAYEFYKYSAYTSDIENKSALWLFFVSFAAFVALTILMIQAKK